MEPVLPRPMVPLDEVALIDAAAVRLGLELADLMEEAGRQVAREAGRLAPDGPVLIACGGGHNGGDGYVAARYLAAAGREVWLWPLAPPGTELTRAMAGRVPRRVRRLDDLPATAPGLVIDAVLGAGRRSPVRPPLAHHLARLAALEAPVLAIDCPSGLGQPELTPARIHVCCLGVAKVEIATALEADAWSVLDIGLPPAAIEEIGPETIRRFPLLDANAHKGQHGEVLVLGGGSFPGALELACRSAAMTGCDLVRAWTSGSHPFPASIIVHRQPGSHLGPADPEHLTPLIARADAVLIGPGLGRLPGAPEAARQLASLAADMEVPVVIDADGIDALRSDIRSQGPAAPPMVITPHAGELTNLLGSRSAPSQTHGFARPNRVVVAKGRIDLVTDGHRWQRNHRGNPRLAMGGTGDCLAGLVAGLLARGAAPYDAARVGLLWLTECGDELWPELGPSYTPEQLVAHLPHTLRRLCQAHHQWPPSHDRTG